MCGVGWGAHCTSSKKYVPKEWLWVLEEVKSLLAELPLEGSRRLFELWKQIPERRTGQEGPRSALEQLRNLLIRLSEHWASYRVFDWDKDVPWTNNGTEQAIGRLKMRSRALTHGHENGIITTTNSQPSGQGDGRLKNAQIPDRR